MLYSEDQPITDIEGNIYKTVKIYNQVWMAENLKTTKYNDGTSIPIVTDSTDWFNLVTPGYCWYNNDEASYKEIYGALYNFYATATGKVCPTGWHVPTDMEWSTLIRKLCGDHEAGAKLKERGTTHWINLNTEATNESDFTALPGGERGLYPFVGGEIGWITSPEDYRKRSNGFYDLGYITTFWSSTYAEFYPDEEGRGGGNGGWRRTFNGENTWVIHDYLNQNYGCSIRCVKD